MSQRVGIAMAIANRPKILLADEPTTALDVTIQAQILDILELARQETQAATILITHDLGVIAEVADRMIVMYAGRVVETGTVPDVFANPQHPYTLGLLASLPRLDTDIERTLPIDGEPPSMLHTPPGCAFQPRCYLSRQRERCHNTQPELRSIGPAEHHIEHHTACHFAEEINTNTPTEREHPRVGIVIGEDQ